MKTEFEPGKTYRMRNGTTADVLSVDDDPLYPVIARHSDDGQRCSHGRHGEFELGSRSSFDLMLPAISNGGPAQ